MEGVNLTEKNCWPRLGRENLKMSRDKNKSCRNQRADHNQGIAMKERGGKKHRQSSLPFSTYIIPLLADLYNVTKE
jgi:hypothetical protein